MKKPGYWVQRWLDRLTEGPHTAFEAGELVEAFTWDGDFRRAHELADVLCKFYVRSERPCDEMMFGQFIGMRTVLHVIILRAESGRKRAADRRGRARA